ncbi:class I lanthipeptide [Kordia jejudonensis]|uniref:class I lanthipeptide n=1 Tax=Kordia jejudonensis TaxID=1348245 RepID=UPI0012E091CF|nr:class I lanthipeptide [Kordia jejudonensis]
MKKQNFKNLSLNKKAVSNLQQQELKGGFDVHTLSFIGDVCHCPPPTADNGSRCRCM